MGTLIIGWLADLFPYVKYQGTDAPTVRNPILAIPRTKLTVKDGLSSRVIPAGLSRSPFSLTSASSDVPSEFEIVGGFLGVTQQADSGQLEPEIGWAVVEPEGFRQVLNKFARAGSGDPTTKRLIADQRERSMRDLLCMGLPKELVQLMDRFADGQVFLGQTAHAWTLKPATEITAWPIGGAQSSQAVHFMDLVDRRVVCYTTVHIGDVWAEKGRIFVGHLEGHAIQAESVGVIANGFTEFLDRLVREEGRYYFDEPSFTSQ